MEKKYPYSEKLKDPRWQKKRLRIFERDKWKCRTCSAQDKPLHVHHLFYFKNKDPWEIDDGFLITLCEECHFSEKEEDEEYSVKESILREIGVLLNIIWASGFNIDDLGEIGIAIGESSGVPPTPAWSAKFEIKQWTWNEQKNRWEK